MLIKLFSIPYIGDYAASFLFAEERGSLSSVCKALHTDRPFWILKDWREIITDPILKYINYPPRHTALYGSWLRSQRCAFLISNYPESIFKLWKDLRQHCSGYNDIPLTPVENPLNNDSLSIINIKWLRPLTKEWRNSYHMFEWLYTLDLQYLSNMKREDILLFPKIKTWVSDPLHTIEADLNSINLPGKNAIGEVYQHLSKVPIRITPISDIMVKECNVLCTTNRKPYNVWQTVSQLMYQIHNHVRVKRLTPRMHQMLHQTRHSPTTQQRLMDIWDTNWETNSDISPHWECEVSPKLQPQQNAMYKRHCRRMGKIFRKKRRIE